MSTLVPPATGSSSCLSSTGGTITVYGGYRIHTFTTSGTFTPSGNCTVNYLVVAGGGGGQTGGAGAGGVLSSTASVSSETPYTVTVGAGGPIGNQGSSSSFGAIATATGGGFGGSNVGNGGNGGSGGGNGYAGGGSGGTGIPGQGNNGATIGPGSAAGGGGAGAAGSANNGGNGISSSISGFAAYYGGGGGGCSGGGGGSGGLGGGGPGGASCSVASDGQPGTANTGGGGGGGYAAGDGGAGGSGIVIIAYVDTVDAPTTSLIFNSASSQYLSITGKTGASEQKFTINKWIKRNSTGGPLFLMYFPGSGTGNFLELILTASNTVQILAYVSSSQVLNLNTMATIADTTTWHNIEMAVDTTQSTAANRVEIYIDNTLETSFSTSVYPAQNTNLVMINAAVTDYIGSSGSSEYFNGYMARFYYIDGQQLPPSDFISGSPGVPIAFTGSFTGVFDSFLNFANGTSTTTLGYDTSGESNNWTLHNMTTANQSTNFP